MISTTNLGFSYPGKEFHFPDMQCAEGNALLITGNSGRGKTTLLHLLGGLQKPQSGIIMIGDTDISKLSATALDRFRGKNIGIVFQQPHFLASLTVLENLLATATISKSGKNKNDAMMLLERLGIADQAGKKPARLSAGQQQRLSIARALMNDPKLVLADEPTASLDDENCAAVAKLLYSQTTQSNAALLIVTHDQRLKSIFTNNLHLS
jgi:ABC-type lipoprotein export system ATPase subunit